METLELFQKTLELKPNDVVRVNIIVEHKEETFSAQIIQIVPSHDKVDILYKPSELHDSIDCGLGFVTIKPEDNHNHAKGKWGWQHLQKI